MNKLIKQILFIPAFSLLASCYVMIFATFLFAYFHNNEVLVTINTFGEGNYEILLLFLSSPAIILFLLTILKKWEVLIE